MKLCEHDADTRGLSPVGPSSQCEALSLVSEGADELHIQFSTTALDHRVVTARGTLSRDTPHLLRAALVKALTEDRRIVLDVAQITLVEPSAALVLPAVLDLADGWPWTKVVLAGPSTPLIEALRTHGNDLLPYYTDKEQAAAHLDERLFGVTPYEDVGVGSRRWA